MKESSRKTFRYKFALIFFLILLFDQVTKFLFGREICNRGIAFGLGNISFVIPLLVLIFLIIMSGKEKGYRIRFGLNLIIAGGFSNLVDRVLYGCVRDFITFLNFPSFNLADAIITVGAFTVLWRYAVSLTLKHE